MLKNKNIPIPENENVRLKNLQSVNIMDTLPEKDYDALTQLASFICKTPIALVSLLDEKRQWFKSSVGLGASETPRDISFCQHAIMGHSIFEVKNALDDPIFANNPLVTGNPDIRFYAGVPLDFGNGVNLGTLCVIDTVPRELSQEQKNALNLLAVQVVNLLKHRQTNVELLKSQRTFLNFFDLSVDLVCVANTNGDFERVSPSFSSLLGYEISELEGVAFADFIHPEDLQTTQEVIEKLSLGSLAVNFENRFRKKDGTYIILSWNAAPDPESGELYAVARDITQERAIKAELEMTIEDIKQAQKDLRDINLAINESTLVSRTDAKGKITYANEKFCEISKYDIFDLIGADHRILNSGYHSKEFFRNLWETISNGIIWKGEIKNKAKDGTFYWVESTIVPFFDNNGNIKEYISIRNEITDIKNAQIILEQKSIEIKNYLNSINRSNATVEFDLNGNVIWANNLFCSLFGYELDVLLTKNHRDFVLDDNMEEYKLFWEKLRKGEFVTGEFLRKNKFGENVWIIGNYNPIVDVDGKVCKILKIANDITVSKQQQLDLDRKNKELDQFAYVVSHDLKAPLRAINNLAEWIIEDMPEMPEDVEKNLQLLRKRVFRMEDLINGVLDYSKVGRTEIKNENIDLTESLGHICETIIPKKGFKYKIDEKMPTFFGPKILIEQIFSNLVSNAVKYNDKAKGEVEILYESIPGFHKFIVKDNGPGIPKEYQEKIFQIFQTIEARDVKESTGIGLSIVQKIIEERGGSIWVESIENVGSSFVFTLPKISEK